MASVSFRKRIPMGNGMYMNVSKSGISFSQKIGDTTINSKGQVTHNLGGGVIIRDNLNKGKNNKGSKKKK